MVGAATLISAACWMVHLPAGANCRTSGHSYGASAGGQPTSLKSLQLVCPCRVHSRMCAPKHTRKTCCTPLPLVLINWHWLQQLVPLTMAMTEHWREVTPFLLTCALHAGLVQDIVQDVSLLVLILLFEDQGGDFHQEAGQLGLQYAGATYCL